MNVPAEKLDAYHYRDILGNTNAFPMKMVFGHCEELYICNTYQFKDYSKYAINMFKEEDKAAYRDAHFSTDLQNAFDLGKRLSEMV